MKPDASLPPAAARQKLSTGVRTRPARPSPHRRLLDGLPGMVFLARVDPPRTLELTSAGGEALLGVKPENLPALGPHIHPEDAEAVQATVQSAVASQHPYAMEYRMRHADGEWRRVWEQGRPFPQGRRMLVQGQLLEAAHRPRLEALRELGVVQAQRFQALNQLAEGVAHEFNNLIAGILGSVELVAMDLPENHPAHETLRQIFEVSNYARDFGYKLRALGQRTPPDFKPVQLQPVIEESLQILRTIIPAKVELQSNIDPACPPVNADAAQIHQAIMDLCLHAWQSLADRRGHILISLEHCAQVRPSHNPAGLLRPGPHVCLTVQDSSPGLEKAAREHVFHPFRNRRSGGNKIGLELFQVRETIQAHHGEIFAKSELGQGLTFHIYLPVAGK